LKRYGVSAALSLQTDYEIEKRKIVEDELKTWYK
jgi:hypothetical protein